MLAPFGQKAAKRRATLLLQKHGSLGAVLAHVSKLEVRGFDNAPAAHLNAIASAMRHVLRHEALGGPVISTSIALADYLRVEMAWLPWEQVRALFLATDNRLLADEVLFRGSIGAVPLYARVVVHRALDLGASGLIIVHNHPSGNSAASRADIESTRDVAAACKAVEIRLHDHIIVARNGWTSLRAQELM